MVEAGDLLMFERDAISLCGLDHQGVQCVTVTQVEQFFWAVDPSAWMPSCVAETACWRHHVLVWCEFVAQGLRAAAGMEVRKAAGESGP